ncbi:heme o synthase [Magnetospira thiophila]
MTLRGYLELCKPRIAFMIALTAVTGYAAVAPTVDPAQALPLFLAMVLGSSGGAVFNHFWDRDLDSLMARTANRPLVTGAMTDPRGALVLAAVLVISGCALAVTTLNWVVAAHLFLGAFVYAIVYTVWLKRRTWLNIVFGGAAGSFAILAGAAASDPSLWLLPMLMAITLFLWTPSHFWALAILLREDYAKAGVPMLPVLVGDARCARYILFNSLALVVSTLLPWAFGALGAVYGALAAAAGGWFLMRNWDLVQDPSRTNARRTFLGSMFYLLAIFIAVVVDKHLAGYLF